MSVSACMFLCVVSLSLPVYLTVCPCLSVSVSLCLYISLCRLSVSAYLTLSLSVSFVSVSIVSVCIFLVYSLCRLSVSVCLTSSVQRKGQNARRPKRTGCTSRGVSAPCITRMPGESYRRRLRSLSLCLRDVFRVLIHFLVCWLSRRKPW